MSCLPISIFAPSGGCAPRMGGIRRIIWALRSDIRVTAVDGPDGGYSFDLATMVGAYQIPVRSGSFSSTAEVSDDGAAFYRDELTFVPVAGSESVASFLAALTSASDDALVIIAEDYNGTSHLLGIGFADTDGNATDFPVWLSGGGTQTGAAHADLNGGQVTLSSVHPLPAVLVGTADITILNPNDF